MMSKFALSTYGHELCNTHIVQTLVLQIKWLLKIVGFDSATSLSYPLSTFKSCLDHLAYLTFDPHTRTTDGRREAKQEGFFNSTTRLHLSSILSQIQKNIVKNIALLSASCLAQKLGNNPDIYGSIAGGRKISRERILCALSNYPVALCTQWVFNGVDFFKWQP